LLFDYYHLACDLWVVLLIVWFIGAFSTKSTARRQSVGSRMAQSVLTVYGLYLVFAQHAHFPAWLRTPFLTPTDATGAIGLLITLLGVAIAIWARVTLGANWSGSVTLKEGHTLVRRGPYALVRHPIYTGFLLGALGVAIITGELRGLVGTAIVFVGFSLKYRTEESFMLENFGEQYVEYQREVKAIIPWVF
jgi:protein-S-isoprenylcysteine O-methyltransferase Ste14